ncbi:MAG: hypothetical protein KOO63_03325 [Bacteroidales bacterium]|nr:hypothetical protein [Candidatus Latescibacterota bacterium]
MDFIESLSFTYALIISAGAAFLISIWPGYLVFRKRRAGRKKDKIRTDYTPQPAVVSSYMSTAVTVPDEFPEMAQRMGTVLDRIESSVGSCVELCGRLLEQEVSISMGSGGRSGPIHDLSGRIREMMAQGDDEETIAGVLSIDREMLKLYLHAGGNRN